MAIPPKPDLVLRVGVAGNRNLPPSAQAGLASRLSAVYDALIESLEALAPAAGSGVAAARSITEYYSNVPPVLYLISGLADGADQLADRLLLNRDPSRTRREIAVILSFDIATYRDQSPVEDKAACRIPLCHRAGRTGRYLPDPAAPDESGEFAKHCRARAYRTRSKALLRQCDLLIAIADPTHEGCAGGTRETMEQALDNGIRADTALAFCIGTWQVPTRRDARGW